MIRAAAVALQSSGKIRPTKLTAAKSAERQEHDTHVDASPALMASPSPLPAHGIDVVDRVSASDGLLQLAPATNRNPEVAQACVLVVCSLRKMGVFRKLNMRLKTVDIAAGRDTA